MKLSELLAALTWADVKAALLWHYPATQEGMEDYRQVFSRLREMDKVASPMRIVLHQVSREGREEKPRTDVTGRDGTLNRELKDFQYLAQPVDPAYANAEVSYSLVYTPWEQWLGMDIDLQTLQDYTAAQVAAHCLWEMTFYGYEESQVQAERDELQRRVDALEAMTEKERKERLIPWEQVRKELEGEEPQ